MSHFIDRLENRKALQRALIFRGYDCGPDGDDGVLGQATQRALMQYCEDHPEVGPWRQMNAKLLKSLNLNQENTIVNTSNNWLSSFVASTAGQYVIAMAATWLASKLGLDQGSVQGIIVQILGLIPAIWGIYQASKSKVVVNGTKVSFASMPQKDQQAIAEIASKTKPEIATK